MTGKSAATDILARKKSLPVLYGLAHSPALVEVYARPKFTAQRRARSRHAARPRRRARSTRRNWKNETYHKALAALDCAKPQPEAGTLLRGLVAWLFERTY